MIQAPCKEPKGTKLELITAAGELFGTQGYMGTSIREIAKKADANVAAVNYHFGSKENLYTEVLLYFARECFDRALSFKIDEERINPDNLREIIEELVRVRFDVYVCEKHKHPEWVSQLFCQCMMRESISLKALLEEVFNPDFESLQDLVKKLCPEMDEATREQWLYTLVGMPVFYSHSRSPILMHMKREDYSEEFVEAAANFLTDSLYGMIMKAKNQNVAEEAHV